MLPRLHSVDIFAYLSTFLYCTIPSVQALDDRVTLVDASAQVEFSSIGSRERDDAHGEIPRFVWVMVASWLHHQVQGEQHLRKNLTRGLPGHCIQSMIFDQRLGLR